MIEGAAMILALFTVSTVFSKSNAIATVRRRVSRRLLKLVVILCTSGNRTEVVDLCLRKPCWVSESLMCRLSSGRIKYSRTLMVGQRSGWAGKRSQGGQVP